MALSPKRFAAWRSARTITSPSRSATPSLSPASRRCCGEAGHPGRKPRIYADAIIQLNFAAREVRIGDEVIALTPSEFRLLAALVRHAGQTLSPDQLLEQAWNDPMRVGPERVKFAIMRLRRKLGQNESSGSPIEAVRGFGYRYVAPPAGWQAKQLRGRPAAAEAARGGRAPQPRRPTSPAAISGEHDRDSRR